MGSCSAAHLVDRVLPKIPYRHWVLAYPHRLRPLLARRASLADLALDLFLAAVFRVQRAQARKAGSGCTLGGEEGPRREGGNRPALFSSRGTSSGRGAVFAEVGAGLTSLSTFPYEGSSTPWSRLPSRLSCTNQGVTVFDLPCSVARKSTPAGVTTGVPESDTALPNAFFHSSLPSAESRSTAPATGLSIRAVVTA